MFQEVKTAEIQVPSWHHPVEKAASKIRVLNLDGAIMTFCGFGGDGLAGAEAVVEVLEVRARGPGKADRR